jgi:hypothetical protein
MVASRHPDHERASKPASGCSFLTMQIRRQDTWNILIHSSSKILDVSSLVNLFFVVHRVPFDPDSNRDDPAALHE